MTPWCDSVLESSPQASYILPMTATAPIPADVLDRLKIAAGEKGWTDDPAALAPHLEEPRGLWHGTTPLLLRPDTTKKVSAILAICHETGTAVVPQGGNTGLTGASVPDASGQQVILSLAKMNTVRGIDRENFTMTAEAGCVLANLQAAADDAGRFFPLSLGAEGSCQIGGNLATNAGGINVLRYGNARDLVLGLEVVLPDGRVLDDLTGLRKDNTGYDLKQLFIGAEGTLGVITAAVLKLFPQPRDTAAALVGLGAPAAAIELFTRARDAAGDALSGFELMPRIGIEMGTAHVPDAIDPLAAPHPWYALIELTSPRDDAGLGAVLEAMLGAAIADGVAADAVVAQSDAQARSFWRLREAIPESQKHEGGSIKHDVSVPVSRIADFIAAADAAVEAAMPGIRPVAFGHVGDGNVHYNLTQPAGADKNEFLAEWDRMNGIVHRIVHDMRGSISAEHGIGRIKRAALPDYKDTVALDLMRAIKTTLDPKGIMNPGKVL